MGNKSPVRYWAIRFVLLLSSISILSCTKATPKIQALGKTVDSFDFASQSQSFQNLDPNASNFTVNGTCSKEVESIQIKHPSLGEWTDAKNISEASSDLDCLDGQFKIVINTQSGPFAFQRDATYSSVLEIRMITKFKEVAIRRIDLNYVVDPNQPKVSLNILNNITEITEGILGTLQFKLQIDKSYQFHTKDITGTISITGTVSANDYSLSSLKFTVPAGSSESLPLTITVPSDNLFELDENMIISIDTVAGALKDTNFQKNIIVHNSDPAPTLSIQNLAGIIEGDNSGAVKVRATLSKAAGVDVKLNVETLDGNVNNTYYETILTQVTIPQGATYIDIPIKAKNPDNEKQTGKYFNLKISAVDPSAIIISNNLCKVEITDDDGNNIIKISSFTNQLPESSTNNPIEITVSLTKPVESTPITVDVKVSGTASVDSEYSLSPTPDTNGIISLSFATGEITKSIQVTPIDDNSYESTKFIVFDLTNNSTSNSEIFLLQKNVTISLIDDDIGLFNLTSIKGTNDTAVVNVAAGGTTPKLNGNFKEAYWSAASGVDSYQFDIVDASLTSVFGCKKTILPSATPMVSFGNLDCSLNSGSSYTAIVTAYRGSKNVNQQVSFVTNSSPIAISQPNNGHWLIMPGSSAGNLAIKSSDLASDADGDTLTVTSASLTSGSGLCTTSTNGGVSYANIAPPANIYLGDVTCTFVIADGKGASTMTSVSAKVIQKFTWTGLVSDDFNNAGNWCTDIASDFLSCSSNANLDSTSVVYLSDFCSFLNGQYCDPIIIGAVSIRGLYQIQNKIAITNASSLSIESVLQNAGEINISNNQGELKVSKSLSQGANGKITGGRLSAIKSDGKGLKVNFSTLGLFEFNGIANISEFYFDKGTESITMNGRLDLSSKLTNKTGNMSDLSNIVFNLNGDLEIISGLINGGTINIIGTNNQSIIPNLNGNINNLIVNKTSGVLSQSQVNNTTYSTRIAGDLMLLSYTSSVDSSISVRLMGGKTSTKISWSSELGWLSILKDDTEDTVNFIGDVSISNTNMFLLRKGTISKNRGVNLIANDGVAGVATYYYKFTKTTNSTGNDNTSDSDWQKQ